VARYKFYTVFILYSYMLSTAADEVAVSSCVAASVTSYLRFS